MLQANPDWRAADGWLRYTHDSTQTRLENNLLVSKDGQISVAIPHSVLHNLSKNMGLAFLKVPGKQEQDHRTSEKLEEQMFLFLCSHNQDIFFF